MVMLAALAVFVCAEAKVKVEKNQIDRATKERVIETSWHSFSTDEKKSLPNVHMRFVYKQGLEFLEIKYAVGESYFVNKNYRLHILSDSKAKMSADAVQPISSTVGGGAIDYVGCHVLGISPIYTADFSWLIDNKPSILRIETTTDIVEIKLPKSIKSDMQKLYKVFFETVRKNYNKK